MAAHEHLILRTIQLSSSETWSNGETGGLSFLFPKTGVGKFVSGPVTQRIGTGEILIVSSVYDGKLSAVDGKEMVFGIFSTCFEHLFPLLSSHEISVLQHVTDEIKRPKWFSATHPVSVECHKLISEATPQPTLHHRGQLLRVAATILSLEFKNAQTKRLGYVPVEDNLVQVFEKLSVTELLTLSVEELADRCNCSRRHLNRLFHQHFKFSVGALKMEIRLLKAVSLLRNPSAKVINVAQDCGFNHLGLFNTCFKRRFGVSPGQWRKTAVDTDKKEAQPVNFIGGCQQLSNGLCPLSVKGDNCESLMRTISKQPSTRQGSGSAQAHL